MSDPLDQTTGPGNSELLSSEGQLLDKGIDLSYEVGQGDAADLLLPATSDSVLVEQVPIQPDLVQTYQENAFTATLQQDEFRIDGAGLYEPSSGQFIQDDCLTNPLGVAGDLPLSSTDAGLIVAPEIQTVTESVPEGTPNDITYDGGFAMQNEPMEIGGVNSTIPTDSGSAVTDLDQNLLQSDLVAAEPMETDAQGFVDPEPGPQVVDESSSSTETPGNINPIASKSDVIGNPQTSGQDGFDEVDAELATLAQSSAGHTADIEENDDFQIPVLSEEIPPNDATMVREEDTLLGTDALPAEENALMNDSQPNDMQIEGQFDEVSLIPEMDKEGPDPVEMPDAIPEATTAESNASEVTEASGEVDGAEADDAEAAPAVAIAEDEPTAAVIPEASDDGQEEALADEAAEPETVTMAETAPATNLESEISDNNRTETTKNGSENVESVISVEIEETKAKEDNEMMLKISDAVTVTDPTESPIVLLESVTSAQGTTEDGSSTVNDNVEASKDAPVSEEMNKVEISSEASTPDPTSQQNGADTEMAIKITDVQSSSNKSDKSKKKDNSQTQQLSVPSPVIVEDDDVAVIGTEKIAVNRHKSTDSSGSGKGADEKELKKETKTPEKKESKQIQRCIVCRKVGKCKYNIVRNGDIKHLCDDECFKIFRAKPTSYLRPEPEVLCDFCKAPVSSGTKLKIELPNRSVKHFCKDHCQRLYKKGDYCTYCGKDCNRMFVSGSIQGARKLYCSAICMNKHKQDKDKTVVTDDDDVEIVGTSQVPKKPQAPSQKSMTSLSSCSTRQIICTVCKEKKSIKHEVSFNRKMHSLCSDKCFAAFRYANKLTMSPCDNCGAFCNDPSAPNSSTETIQFEGRTKKFCGSVCLTSFKTKNKKTKLCAWCNSKKNIFEMVERVDANNKVQLFCSLNCLSLYRVNLQATSNQQVKCDQCNSMAPAQYHLTMSDASVRNFCSYSCVISFQSQFNQPNKSQKVATANTAVTPQANVAANRSTRQSARVAARSQQSPTPTDSVPIISDVVSLAHATNPKPMPQKVPEPSPAKQTQQVSTGTVTQHIIIEPPKPKQVRNKSLLCKPYCQTKATSCRPHTQNKETQTMDLEPEVKQVLIPVPVPIYMPTPMAMYSAPMPYPLPIPVPIPIPCFIPTTKKSADSILKHIQEIQERMPADPFEAELLMMAEAVATADKSGSDSSDTDEDEGPPLPTTSTLKSEPIPFEPEPEAPPPAPTNELGEDMLQMALRMASEISEEPVLDLEDSLNPTPIQPGALEEASEFSTIDHSNDILTSSPRGRRGRRGRGRGRSKRPRLQDPVTEPESPDIKPAMDANMVLKYTYGVNAWKHWVVQKNALLEKATSSSRRKLKLFKTDLLACTADELNYSLCLFVKEVRKPNGEEYACDSIFYLCLGIQQYLYENGRIDNIFTDLYYDRFTECLNEVLLNYEVRLNAQGLIVCRIEEEHLWESKQLGAHSPYILLNTLIYFNTKFFHLKSPEDHIRLSFSHIMKHWKRSNGQPVSSKAPAQAQGAKSVYLRYYAPAAHSGPEAGQKRKREEAPVFEQGENTDNPLRCPVKLYEFYLSKCPESIKNRNDVFYLVPERSCVPDSPVWYSTGALSIETMTKMLNRLRVVREIQETYLHIDRGMYMS